MTVRGKPPITGPQDRKDDIASRSSKSIDVALSSFGLQLRALRKQRRITQQEIERRSGLTQSGLSKAENGDGNLSIRTILQLAIGLQVPPSFLVALLDGCTSLPQPRASSTVTQNGVPILYDGSVGPDSVKQLTRELEAVPASTRKPRGKSRSGRA